eukprot:5143886-Prymnesium_polylepis.1
MVSGQLAALAAGGEGAHIKQVIARTHASFARMAELGASMKAVVDHSTYLDFLTSFVAVVKSLTPGSSLVVPGGWKGGALIY